MQRAAFTLGEVIAFVVRNQVDDRPLGQGRRLVKNEPPVFDTCSERAHVATVRVSELAGKSSGCTPKPLDLLKP